MSNARWRMHQAFLYEITWLNIWLTKTRIGVSFVSFRSCSCSLFRAQIDYEVASVKRWVLDASLHKDLLSLHLRNYTCGRSCRMVLTLKDHLNLWVRTLILLNPAFQLGYLSRAANILAEGYPLILFLLDWLLTCCYGFNTLSSSTCWLYFVFQMMIFFVPFEYLSLLLLLLHFITGFLLLLQTMTSFLFV